MTEQAARRWGGEDAAGVGSVVVVEALSAASLAEIGEHRVSVWLFSAALGLPLVARRRAPVAVFAVVALMALVQWTLNLRLVADLALLVALYTVAAMRERRETFVLAGVVELGVVLASVRFAPAGGGVLGSLVFLSGLVVAATFVGISVQTRHTYVVSLEERAAALERSRDQQAQLAVIEERARIAREMHDVVAHHLAVMIALADGANATAAKDPQGAAEAMRQVSSTGRTALAEMRRLLGVLRERGGDASRVPVPSLEGIADLVDGVRGTGIDVRLDVTGRQRDLPPTAQVAIYRVLQESLTNALKHGHDVRCIDVHVHWASDALELEVADDGRAASSRDSGSSGHGIAGMRERMAVFGGALTAGPNPGIGWRVRAVLPYDRALV